mgnify:FL=1
MHYIIDAYNLLGQMDSISLSESGKEQKLIDFLQRFAKSIKLSLVFDGKEDYSFARKERLEKLTVIYSPIDQSADAYIIEKLKGSSNDLCAVTNDREIVAAAKKHKCQTLSCQAFLALILTRDTPSDSKSQTIGSIDEWLDTFENNE